MGEAQKRKTCDVIDGDHSMLVTACRLSLLAVGCVRSSRTTPCDWIMSCGLLSVVSSIAFSIQTSPSSLVCTTYEIDEKISKVYRPAREDTTPTTRLKEIKRVSVRLQLLDVCLWNRYFRNCSVIMV